MQNEIKNQNYVIIGGNGKTGIRVKNLLEAEGKNVVSVSRSSEVPFDWYNSATWDNALSKAHTVYATFQPDLAIPEAVGIIEAFVESLKKNNVSKIVLLSGRGEPAAQKCEDLVINSGLKWNVVRAGWFNQNFSENFLLEPVLQGNIYLPVAAGITEPFIDVNDIAEIAVKAMVCDDFSNKLFEVTGPELLSFNDIANILSEELGREINYHPIPIDAYVEEMKKANIPDEYISLITYLFTEVLDGRNQSTTNTIEEVLGKKARTFREYVRETALSGIWNK